MSREKPPNVSTSTAVGTQSPIHASVNKKKPPPMTSDPTSARAALACRQIKPTHHGSEAQHGYEANDDQPEEPVGDAHTPIVEVVAG